MALSLSQIDNYIEALLVNAESLVSEAFILFENGFYARAYTLSHLAREELSKCVILYAAGRRIIAGIEVDWKKTLRRLRDHKSKIQQDIAKSALTAAAFENEELSNVLARSIGPLADYKNTSKNDSIYVGMDQGDIVSPIESISKEKAERCLLLAKISLDEDKEIHKSLGRLSEMDTSKMEALPELSFDSPEEIIDMLKNVAPLYAKVLQEVHKEHNK